MMGFNAVYAFTLGGGNYLLRKKIDKRVALLCHFDGNLKDSSSYAYPGIVNVQSGSVVYENVGKYGNCITTNNTYTGIYYPGCIPDFSGDFTVECFGRMSQTGSSNLFVLGKYSVLINTVGSWHGIYNSDTTSIVTTFGNAVNVFAHYAAVRYNGSLKVYVNGVCKWTLATTEDFTPSGGTLVNECRGGSGAMIEELRIVVDKAVWTDNFTPPSAPYSGYEAL